MRLNRWVPAMLRAVWHPQGFRRIALHEREYASDCVDDADRGYGEIKGPLSPKGIRSDYS